jgi:hypothetical protein
MPSAAQPDQPNEQAILAAITLLLMSDAPAKVVAQGVVALLVPLGITPIAAIEAVRLLYAHTGPVESHPVGSALGVVARMEWPRRAAYVVQAARRITEGVGNVPTNVPMNLPTGLPKSAGSAAEHVVATEAERVAAFGQAAQQRLERATRDPFQPSPVPTEVLDPVLERERTYFAQHLNAARARREAAVRVDQEAQRLGSPVLGWHAIRDSRTTPECAAADGHNFEASRPPKIGYPGTLHGGTCRCKPGRPFPGQPHVDEVVVTDRPSPRSGAAHATP